MPEYDADYDVSENPYAAPETQIDGGVGSQMQGAPLAGRLQRLGCQLADGLFGLIAGLPLIVGMIMSDPDIGGGGNSGPGLVLIGIGGIFMLAFFIMQLYLLSRDGQTLGKKVGKVRIVDYNDGSHPGLGRIFGLRMLVPGVIGAIPILGGLFSIADPLFIFGEERRCLHDLIATTKVVEA